MTNRWREARLPEVIAALARRPGHEQVRVLLAELLREGLGIDPAQLRQEDWRARVRGRIDTLFGDTLFELKRDLRQERAEVERRLPDYLADVERETGRRALGIATDGAVWIAFERGEEGLAELRRFELAADTADPAALLRWLEPAVGVRGDLAPEAQTVREELGRESLVWARARGELARLWRTLADNPEAQLKRKLWDDLLAEVYGTRIGDEALFLQHTYLTIVAKTIALHVLETRAESAEALLSGRALAEAGIVGAVESDFFDWVLHAPGGDDFVLRLARQTERFRLHDAETDVLKALYENLIDPSERRILGEYYTPDWLAAEMVRAAIPRPLEQTVLDPACGSGTFLFRAVRRLLEAAREARRPIREAVALAAERVRGIDIHPVAVIFARVTWLLALGEAVRQRPERLSVPVFLGDSMQWNLREAVGGRDVVVAVPDDAPITIPAGFAENQAAYDAGLAELTRALRQGTEEGLVAALRRLNGVSEADARAMVAPFRRLRALYQAGRNDIWPFVLRNLVRPLWLSRAENRAEVVIGNPPWVRYNDLAPAMQDRLREALRRERLWAGQRYATSQDLAALFWVRSAERYLNEGGRIAFVLPHGFLTRPAFRGVRQGVHATTRLVIEAGWRLDGAEPVFPNLACVLFARRVARPARGHGEATVLPATVRAWVGHLPRRDATAAEAAQALRVRDEPWPQEVEHEGRSPYARRFRDGATIYPRRLFFVEPLPAGRLGANPAAPRVRGRAGNLDKPPWNAVTPPQGPVEARFLRPVVLGETILPFLLRTPATAVVPMGENGTVMDARAADIAGFPNLTAWLRDAEAKWAAHASRRASGELKMGLRDNLDHLRKLSIQHPPAPLRVVYAKAGTHLAAAILSGSSALVDHTAYWAAVETMEEGRYLTAILNADETRQRVERFQARGLFGPRHFDKLVWQVLAIPEFDPRNCIHRRLAEAAAQAEAIAASVPLEESRHFRAQRAAIRRALAEAGLAAELHALVAELLG
ncbi:N-6 DNA methylase [Elioraea thermophila]|uniref:N-6 DNA methylase n=1 Tax=Elioraea thermophila TaxID=2185104 RepID=UPI000DF16AB4|nr:N-6 DNA methylase [Elioraea thermophila]